MKSGHIHLSFQDLTGAVSWMKSILNIEPTYQNSGMAVFALENMTYVFDAADCNTIATIAIDSADCDSEAEQIRQRGASLTSEPADQPWGVRTSYFTGPGGLTFEIEQTLK